MPAISKVQAPEPKPNRKMLVIALVAVAAVAVGAAIYIAVGRSGNSSPASGTTSSQASENADASSTASAGSASSTSAGSASSTSAGSSSSSSTASSTSASGASAGNASSSNGTSASAGASASSGNSNSGNSGNEASSSSTPPEELEIASGDGVNVEAEVEHIRAVYNSIQDSSDSFHTLNMSDGYSLLLSSDNSELMEVVEDGTSNFGGPLPAGMVYTYMEGSYTPIFTFVVANDGSEYRYYYYKGSLMRYIGPDGVITNWPRDTLVFNQANYAYSNAIEKANAWAQM